MVLACKALCWPGIGLAQALGWFVGKKRNNHRSKRRGLTEKISRRQKYFSRRQKYFSRRQNSIKQRRIKKGKEAENDLQ